MHGRVSSLLEVGTGFHPELTGRENVYMNGTLLGMRKREIDRRFDEIVEFSGVERFLDTPIKRYSSGMKVRLAFSVAAHLESEILIVDEVLAVGDAEFQRWCVGRMKDVARGGARTVLFVSHNMPAVRSLCSRGLLLVDGQVAMSGEPYAITQAYLDGQRGSSDAVNGVVEVPGRLVRKIEIINASGLPSPVFCTGDPCAIRITLECPEPVYQPVFGIGISDGEGRRLFTQLSQFTNFEPMRISGKARVVCTFPRLKLLPGRYLLKVAVGTRTQPELDSFDAVAAFDVSPGDFFGTGRMPTESQGVFADDADWELLVGER
jgi:lipopolysaccharide transport system ATP-binding protein